MIGSKLDTISIEGFKSIQSLRDFALKDLNILIGGNGAGKSNFIDVFRMLRAMMELSLPDPVPSNLGAYFTMGGGMDDFLFNGPKATSELRISLAFGLNKYRFSIAPTVDENFLITKEECFFDGGSRTWKDLRTNSQTPGLILDKEKKGYAGGKSVSWHVYQAIDSWRIYHFHDTSRYAPVRRPSIIQDNEYFRFDAANIAPFLLRLREENSPAYSEIVETIRTVTPFFQDFILKPRNVGEKEKVSLGWRQKGSDYPLQQYHFSDGTLRFICLATALLQPDPPSTMIIDEPELGLHPYAITVLAELMHAASTRTQLIVSTQSPALVDHFEPDDVIVVNRKHGASTFARLNEDDLKGWLDEYSLGDLWRKNIVAGGPDHE